MTPTTKKLLDLTLSPNALWLPHPENKPQIAAYISEADVLYYGGAAGGGKALWAGSRVVTPTGFRAIGDLKVGDVVCNPNGSYQKVRGFYPQGKQQLYRVVFEDGSEVLTTGDHRWVYTSKGSVATRSTTPFDLTTGLFGWERGTTQELQVLAAYVNYTPRVIPITRPVEFLNELPEGSLDPYLLGVLLGAGKLDGPGVSLEGLGGVLAERLGTSKNWIEGEDGELIAKGNVRDYLNWHLDKLGLKQSAEKYIPDIYKTTTLENRLSLLQGILDSAGKVVRRGLQGLSGCDIQLTTDVRELVWSLGGKSFVGLGSTLLIRVPLNIQPFRDPDKLSRSVDNAYLRVETLKRGISYIESDRIDEAVCISVDDPNGLYLTEGYIVTHNSDLLLGLAVTAHEKTIIFRREYVQLRELVDRSHEILENTPARYSQTEARWKDIPGGKTLEFGAVQREKDKEKFKGRPHDLIAFDEIPDFTETQFRFLMAWNRTTMPGQRCRVVCAGNPPTTPEGRWVVRYWAPWLRKDYSNPARPGELRWFVSMDGRDLEVDGPDPITHHGETIYPKSRTFIPSFVTDNPYFSGTDYLSQLQALPEPLRSQLLSGNFFLEEQPQIRQVIPTEWVRQAIARWKPDDIRAEQPPTDVGLDPSRGGADQTVLSPRVGTYFKPLIVYDGYQVPDGNVCATYVIEELGDEFEGLLRVDIIGIGAGCYDILSTSTEYQLADINFSAKSYATDRSGKLQMRNVRAEAYWTMREALDPEHGDHIALPPDEELVEDLTTPLWTRTTQGILIEDKEQVRKRLGRSPGKGDAVVISYMNASPGVLFR